MLAPRVHTSVVLADRQPTPVRSRAGARRRIRLVAPALLLLAFAHEKAGLDPVTRYERMGDGAFYYQIAQHVAAGEGLRTSVSLFGQGLRELPAPTSVQPLWPLLLGWSGRWLGLDRAAECVPETLYFVSLLLLYVWANRIARAVGSDVLLAIRGVPVLDVGAAAVALLGSNAVFSAYTSKAYSEGLAFALLLASLLALPAHASRHATARAALAGALAGLAYLARSQLVGAPLALGVALGVGGVRRPALRWAAPASLAASAAVVLPWIAHLLASLRWLSPRVLVDFSAYRETPELARPALLVPFAGPLERLLDALASIPHAFHPTAPLTYVESFGPVVHALPAAALLAGWRWLRRRSRSDARAAAREPVLPLASLLVAAAALVPLHAAHMALGPEWLFHWRHGLPLILAIVPALALLAPLGALARVVGVALVGVSTFLPAHAPRDYVLGNERATWEAERRLVEWLDAHPQPPVLLALYSRSLAAQSRAVAHQLDCTSPQSVMQQLDVLPIDYLVVHVSAAAGHCPELADLPAGRLELVRRFGRGWRQIWVARLAAPSGGTGSLRPAE
jgi:hypothetical protein